MLPENLDLRRAHAPLSEFVRHTYVTPLLFSPRSEFRYQSMGILLAVEIVERLSGTKLRDFGPPTAQGPPFDPVREPGARPEDTVFNVDRECRW